MRHSGSTVTALAVPVVLLLLGGCSRPDLEASLGSLRDRYGVSVVYHAPEELLPTAWLVAPYSAKVEPVRPADLVRLIAALDRPLSKYPREVLDANLEQLLVVRSLEMLGVQYAGTIHGRSLFITSDSTSEGYDERLFELLFHHEFSSILMRENGFDLQAWVLTNPEPLHYGKSLDEILALIGNASSLDGSPAWYRLGLLGEYGLASPEDDANLYAELALSDPERMRALAAKYPAIRAKYRVLRDFYVGLHAGFESVLPRPDPL